MANTHVSHGTPDYTEKYYVPHDSPWPIIGSVALFTLMIGAIAFLNEWGGGWVFEYANMNPKLRAAYSFYGTAPDNPSKVANIACPVYGFYAGNDDRVNATVPTAQDLMRRANKKYEPVRRGESRIHARRGKARCE